MKTSRFVTRACARISETCTGACTYLHLVCIYLQVNELQNTIWLHLLAPEVAPACTASLRCKHLAFQVQAPGASRCKHLDTHAYIYARVGVRQKENPSGLCGPRGE